MKVENTIEEKISTFIQLLNDIHSEAETTEGKYTKETCPLNKTEEDHSFFSQLIFGIGGWKWECSFCGTKFQE